MDLMSARHAVGRSVEARIRWLLDFSQLRADHRGLYPGPRGRARWSWELLAFARGAGPVDAADPPAWDQVVELRNLLDAQVLHVLRRGAGELDLPKVKVRLELKDGRLGSAPLTRESSFPLQDAFLLQVHEALVRLPEPYRIRFCAKVGCGNPFLATRKDTQTCSAQCSLAVRTTRWREANRPKVNKARRQRYRRQVLGR